MYYNACVIVCIRLTLLLECSESISNCALCSANGDVCTQCETDYILEDNNCKSKSIFVNKENKKLA